MNARGIKGESVPAGMILLDSAEQERAAINGRLAVAIGTHHRPSLHLAFSKRRTLAKDGWRVSRLLHRPRRKPGAGGVDSQAKRSDKAGLFAAPVPARLAVLSY